MFVGYFNQAVTYKYLSLSLLSHHVFELFVKAPLDLQFQIRPSEQVIQSSIQFWNLISLTISQGYLPRITI